MTRHAWIIAGTSVVRVMRSPESASTTAAGSKSSWMRIEAPLANVPSAVTAAEPTANPFAIAAVVLPSESSASVTSRTDGSSSAISAMPPALSAIGP